jgi:uncharacterized protein (DUF2147 family)
VPVQTSLSCPSPVMDSALRAQRPARKFRTTALPFQALPGYDQTCLFEQVYTAHALPAGVGSFRACSGQRHVTTAQHSSARSIADICESLVRTDEMQPYFLALATILPMPAAAAEATLEGQWRNPSESVTMSISPCGEALCGRVLWASDKAMNDARKGGTDPLVGAVLLSEIVTLGEGRWNARLFVPDLKRVSRAKLRQLGTNRLKVTGCAVGGLLCKSQIWTRADAK